MPSGNKSLSDPILSQIYVGIERHKATMIQRFKGALMMIGEDRYRYQHIQIQDDFCFWIRKIWTPSQISTTQHIQCTKSSLIKYCASLASTLKTIWQTISTVWYNKQDYIIRTGLGPNKCILVNKMYSPVSCANRKIILWEVKLFLLRRCVVIVPRSVAYCSLFHTLDMGIGIQVMVSFRILELP